MRANKKLMETDWSDPGVAPDLSSPEWQKKFASVIVARGRPRTDSPKISTTLRLDADVIDQFKAKGPGWQTRINQALREWLKQAG